MTCTLITSPIVLVRMYAVLVSTELVGAVLVENYTVLVRDNCFGM